MNLLFKIRLQEEDGEIYVAIVEIKRHEKYMERSLRDNDIALLFLAERVQISSTVGIACLPPRTSVQETFIGTYITYPNPT
jgi:hypothetical protein